jgi:hypothetical protein
MGSRLSWPQIKDSETFRGRWVALDDCRYDSRTAQPVEGTVVDSDEDLVALCSRMQESDEATEPPPSSVRAPRMTPIPPRPLTH